MRTATPANEQPARNVLTVGVSCATNTLKRVACVTLYFARPVYPSIKPSTRSLRRRIAVKLDENGRAPKQEILFYLAITAAIPTIISTKNRKPPTTSRTSLRKSGFIFCDLFLAVLAFRVLSRGSFITWIAVSVLCIGTYTLCHKYLRSLDAMKLWTGLARIWHCRAYSCTFWEYRLVSPSWISPSWKSWEINADTRYDLHSEWEIYRARLRSLGMPRTSPKIVARG
jgi:hypothetical protein